jgi:hypothetical protein
MNCAFSRKTLGEKSFENPLLAFSIPHLPGRNLKSKEAAYSGAWGLGKSQA